MYYEDLAKVHNYIHLIEVVTLMSYIRFYARILNSEDKTFRKKSLTIIPSFLPKVYRFLTVLLVGDKLNYLKHNAFNIW